MVPFFTARFDTQRRNFNQSEARLLERAGRMERVEYVPT